MEQVRSAAGSALKIIVIDDDPTGSQTVHGCPLLLRWDAASLEAGLRHPSPLLFLLANTRALAPEQARARVLALCGALRAALAAVGVEHWVVVSRGDSTLRSHFPIEVEAIAAELGPFDGALLVPAFLEGGRTTVAGVHRLDGLPVHQTPFAQDRLFGYDTSDLPDWIERKSGGRIAAGSVQRLGLAELDGEPAALQARLAALGDQTWMVVDAEHPRQLAALGEAVRRLTLPGPERPRRFLFQSAASLLNGLARLPPQPLDPAGLVALRRCAPAGAPLPGLVLVGSHVPLADAQLERLLADPGCVGVEIDVAKVHRLLEGPLPDLLLASLEQAWLEQLRAVLASGRTPVLHTSRGELRCRHAQERRALGLALAASMARLVAALEPGLGYVISKGGITTHTLLEEGLAQAAVELQGQLLPGLSLVLTAAALPVLTFPGNLGDATTLWQAWRRMEEGTGDQSPPLPLSAPPPRSPR